MATALLIVDIQKDFCLGGSLAVEKGDLVVDPANRLVRCFEEMDWPIYFTRDWHPGNHCSFQANGGPWPPHCVADTSGADFHADLHVPDQAVIISKATNEDKDAYSGFEGTDLDQQLKGKGVESVILAGLTTDYCVKNTALDACRLGYNVTVAVDAIRGVNVYPDDARCAIELMRSHGIEFVESGVIMKRLSK